MNYLRKVFMALWLIVLTFTFAYAQVETQPAGKATKLKVAATETKDLNEKLSVQNNAQMSFELAKAKIEAASANYQLAARNLDDASTAAQAVIDKILAKSGFTSKDHGLKPDGEGGYDVVKLLADKKDKPSPTTSRNEEKGEE